MNYAIVLRLLSYILMTESALLLLPALAIFGGFLFQLVWEGKNQYILQYFMLALPYGAAGLNEMAAALKTRILRLRSRQSKTAKAG